MDTLNITPTDLSKLKNQKISYFEDLGDVVKIKTANFEIVIPKDGIVQKKEFSGYPKIISIEKKVASYYEEYGFMHKVTQLSKRKYTIDACVFFTRIPFYLGETEDLQRHGLISGDIRGEIKYKEIFKHGLGIMNFFPYLVSNLSLLTQVNLETLEAICKEYRSHVFDRATIKPIKPEIMYTVRECENGYIFHDLILHRIIPFLTTTKAI